MAERKYKHAAQASGFERFAMALLPPVGSDWNPLACASGLYRHLFRPGDMPAGLVASTRGRTVAYYGLP